MLHVVNQVGRGCVVFACLALPGLVPTAGPTAAATTAAAGAHANSPDVPPVQLVESLPVETNLGESGLPQAKDVWLEMIDGASTHLDWAAFYISSEEGSAFASVLAAMHRAAERGVAIRVLADAGFYETYPDNLDALAATQGIAVRLIDYRGLVGGPMHAKYFLVDGRECFLGSQNSDWRALEHIVEMGARIRVAPYVRALGTVFTMDWQRGTPLGDSLPGSPSSTPSGEPSGEPSGTSAKTPAIASSNAPDYGSPYGHGGPIAFEQAPGDTAMLWPAFSPQGQLPSQETWDLPLILRSLRGARDSVSVTFLSYKPHSRDGTYWEVLETELRAAAVRGVAVRVLTSDWTKRSPTIDFLKSLHLVPGVEVRLVTIPQASTGFIPFARVTHAKYLTVDGKVCWLGTSNWEKSYFHTSRNVGFLAESSRLTGELDRAFRRLWDSDYAYAVDPAKQYEPARVAN